MNTEIKLRHCTIRFKDYLLKDLAQPEFAKGYLEAALQDFDKDGNIELFRTYAIMFDIDIQKH